MRFLTSCLTLLSLCLMLTVTHAQQGATPPSSGMTTPPATDVAPPKVKTKKAADPNSPKVILRDRCRAQLQGQNPVPRGEERKKAMRECVSSIRSACLNEAAGQKGAKRKELLTSCFRGTAR